MEWMGVINCLGCEEIGEAVGGVEVVEEEKFASWFFNGPTEFGRIMSAIAQQQNGGERL